MSDPAWNDPPLHVKVEVAVSSFGWLILAGMAGGTAWWRWAFRRVVRGT